MVTNMMKRGGSGDGLSSGHAEALNWVKRAAGSGVAPLCDAPDIDEVVRLTRAHRLHGRMLSILTGLDVSADVRGELESTLGAELGAIAEEDLAFDTSLREVGQALPAHIGPVLVIKGIAARMAGSPLRHCADLDLLAPPGSPVVDILRDAGYETPGENPRYETECVREGTWLDIHTAFPSLRHRAGAVLSPAEIGRGALLTARTSTPLELIDHVDIAFEARPLRREGAVICCIDSSTNAALQAVHAHNAYVEQPFPAAQATVRLGELAEIGDVARRQGSWDGIVEAGDRLDVREAVVFAARLLDQIGWRGPAIPRRIAAGEGDLPPQDLWWDGFLMDLEPRVDELLRRTMTFEQHLSAFSPRAVTFGDQVLLRDDGDGAPAIRIDATPAVLTLRLGLSGGDAVRHAFVLLRLGDFAIELHVSPGDAAELHDYTETGASLAAAQVATESRGDGSRVVWARIPASAHIEVAAMLRDARGAALLGFRTHDDLERAPLASFVVPVSLVGSRSAGSDLTCA